jgi:peptide/nickel transport system substrate-binding protein
MLDSRPLSRRLGACLAIFALVAAACGSSTATPTTAPGTAAPTGAAIATGTVGASPAGTPDNTPRGGSMTLIQSSDVTSWDPCVTVSAGPFTRSDQLNALYGALVYVDGKGNIVPSMAKSLTSTDAITWTFKLREGVTFTDGTPYDAAAVKYEFDRIADPANACTSQKWVATWAGTTAVDSTTVTVKLPAADSSFPWEISDQLAYIASPAALKAAGSNKTNIKPVGAGPFKVASWNQGISSTYVRNDGYWDQPRPYLDGLKFVVIADTNARIATVVQGGALAMAGYMFQYGSNATAPGVTTFNVPIPLVNFLYFNNSTGLFSDVRARQAVMTGVSAPQILAALTQSDIYKSPTTWFQQNSSYYDPSLAFPTYDKAKAQSLIDALNADGKPFKVNIVTANNSDTIRAADYMQQALNAYKGVTASVQLIPPTSMTDVCLNQHKFDICIVGGAVAFNGPEPTTTSALSSTGVNNYEAYKSTEMDAALQAAKAAVTDADKVAAYKTVQQIFIKDLPLFPYGIQVRDLLIRDNMGGIVVSGQGMPQEQYLYLCPQACPKQAP